MLKVYLKKVIVWIRFLVSVVLVLSHGKIFIRNYFASTSKDVSEIVIAKLLNALNSESFGGLVV